MSKNITVPSKQNKKQYYVTKLHVYYMKKHMVQKKKNSK